MFEVGGVALDLIDLQIVKRGRADPCDVLVQNDRERQVRILCVTEQTAVYSVIADHGNSFIPVGLRDDQLGQVA